MQARLSRTEPQGAEESFVTSVIVNVSLQLILRIAFVLL